MADPTSYIELLEQSQQLEYLINSNCISEEEKEELEVAWNFITSRSESKFDCIIGVIKECDKCIDQSAKEIKEFTPDILNLYKKYTNTFKGKITS